MSEILHKITWVIRIHKFTLRDSEWFTIRFESDTFKIGFTKDTRWRFLNADTDSLYFSPLCLEAMITAKVIRTPAAVRPTPRVMYSALVSALEVTPSPSGRQMTPATEPVSQPRPPAS